MDQVLVLPWYADVSTVRASSITKHNPKIEKAISGALFDFLGFLTSRDERLKLSAYDNCVPALEALKEWAKKRDLNLEEADVKNWEDTIHARKCKTVINGDQTLCTTCGMQWDTNDSQPPECPKHGN